MAERDRSALWLWAAVVVLIVGFLVIRAFYAGFDGVQFGDNDDAMRMVVVRDFLSGQNWFDHTQYRLNTPWGADMHWSRLVDVPIALLVLLARPLAGASAEIVAGWAWPTILLGVYIWLNGRLSQALVGREGLLPGMLIGAFSVITFGEFEFGRVDHHSVQIILTQLTVLFAIQALSHPRAALWAGLAVATSLAIGTETLPVVVAAILVFGLLYIVAPSQHAAVRWFGLAFGLGTLGHLLIALPPSLWFSPACDAISIVYAVAALAAGLGLAGLTVLPLNDRPWGLRLAAGAVAGAAVLALVVWLFPDCLGGPYASVDPWLVEHWLTGISEAKPLLSVLDSQPVYVVGATVPAILALAAALHAAWRNHGLVRSGWLILALMLAVILAVAFVQVRSIRITAAFLAPACAYWVVLARTRYLARTTIGTVLGLVGAWLGFAGVVWAGLAFLVGNALPSPAASEPPTVAVDRGACVAPAAYADLLGMPSTRIMTPVDLGAYVLLYTEHAVVSAPYHRNNRGLLDTFAFFNQPLEQGRAILDERGITLVVTCFALPEMEGIPEADEDSFVRLAARDALPDWLEEISEPEAPLTIYRVQPR